MPADTGVRLQLFIGPTVPRPAPFAVIDALVSLEVRNNDRDRDGFQMTFTLGRDSPLDYSLLLNNYFEPPSRVIIQVLVGVTSQILIDGIITNHQVMPGTRAGSSTLAVTGEDISLRMDLEERSATYENQSDSDIVNTILRNYMAYGLRPAVTETSDRPQENQRVPTQQGTDLAFIRELARRNGFVFYVEPTAAQGINTAYWGPPNFEDAPQPALSFNMGADTNVDSLNFSFNALGPATPEVTILDPTTRQQIPVPVPASTRPPLASRPTVSMRRTLPRNTANKDQLQAALQAVAISTASADAVNGSGQLDAVRYGHILRARKLVSVRGVGNNYGGLYYVKQVTHRIKRGEYKQSFSLSREGRGSTTPVVMP